jgi:eukaryotic-like serine/threonine-protein kinase
MTTSSSDRWRVLQRLLDDVLDRPPEARDAHIASLTDVDDAMRSELTRLARASAEVSGFLDRPAAEMMASHVVAPDDMTASGGGRRIGAYRVVREIGRGGMGAVYLAERADDQFKQSVALKLLPHESRSSETVRRFIDERQILATMEHPAIARLLDGGVTDDGLPYFAMEFVDGAPIDEYCDTKRLTIDARLQLFLQICDAAQYAHRKLVIHRDIKPSNILVTGDGRVRLLDFGIAKLLSADATHATATGTRLMTPEYASPEQVRGQHVTTATDVYSLGVLLYRLLTGRRPYRSTGVSYAEVVRAILDDDPRPPSEAIHDDAQMNAGDVAAARQTSPERLRRVLEGDLDLIVLRALQKEADRRYGSVEQLAADLVAHLDGGPVSARKDSVGYRALKFTRRNRGLVAGATIALAALLAGTTVSIWQAVRATAQARIATAARARAERDGETLRQTSAFLAEIFQSANPEHARGKVVTARELLDLGAARIERQMTQPSEVRAAALEEIGRAYTGLGLDSAAGGLLERAAADYAALDGRDSPQVVTPLTELGGALVLRDKLDSAETLLRRALTLSRRHFGDADGRTAEALTSLGVALQVRGHYDESRRAHEEALSIRRQAHDSAEASVSLVNLAWIHQVQGNLDSAIALSRRAVELRRRIYPVNDPRTRSAISALAAMLTRAGRYNEAEPLAREALATAEKLYGANAGLTSSEMVSLGDILAGERRFREADSVFRAGIAITRRVYGDSTLTAASAMNTFAASVERQGRTRDALRWYSAALDAYRHVLGPMHPFTAIVAGNVATAHHSLGNAGIADTMYLSAIAVMRKAWGDDNPSTVNATVAHALILHALGRHRAAEAELRPALERARRAFPSGHWRIGVAESVLGSVLSAERRFDEADTLIVRGYETLAARLGHSAIETKRARAALVAHYERWGRPELAGRYRSDDRP